MHEFVASARSLAKDRGIRAMDIAKRLIDFNFHAPTVYFPLIVPEAMMIEPTETESRETLEAFAKVLLAIAAEDPSSSTTPRTRRRSAGPTRSRPPRRRSSSGRPRRLVADRSDNCHFRRLDGRCRRRDDKKHTEPRSARVGRTPRRPWSAVRTEKRQEPRDESRPLTVTTPPKPRRPRPAADSAIRSPRLDVSLDLPANPAGPNGGDKPRATEENEIARPARRELRAARWRPDLVGAHSARPGQHGSARAVLPAVRRLPRARASTSPSPFPAWSGSSAGRRWGRSWAAFSSPSAAARRSKRRWRRSRRRSARCFSA